MHGGAAIEPLSPMPLTPIGLVGEGVSWNKRWDVRHVLGARHGIVEQRAGQELPVVGIVADLFIERLRDALHHAAMDLARPRAAD